jgi:transposase InsO family protein
LKAKLGGMDVSEAKRLKALEDENAKLKKLLAEQMLDDQFANGRRFRILNIVDDVGGVSGRDPSISGRRVARELTAIVAWRGNPGSIVSDNGTEFTCNAMLAWCQDNSIEMMIGLEWILVDCTSRQLK